MKHDDDHEPQEPSEPETAGELSAPADAGRIRVRRMHRRDITRVWEFLIRTFREVNRQTVEYQRPRSKQRFVEQYDDDGIEQLLFEVDGDLVGYAECAFNVTGSDNWINPRYFMNRDMRPMYVEELAAHPAYQGRGVGSFMLEQLEHIARLHGCTHMVLEVAENNQRALEFYRKRSFTKLDAALFLARKLEHEPELLPPRPLKPAPPAPPKKGKGSKNGSANKVAKLDAPRSAGPSTPAKEKNKAKKSPAPRAEQPED
ncbi:MAG: N-acetyltransferase [Deltaproteobacteria bacterium HGW-Deltaproteobacteria-14]|nr:MAG: N-acetyltransferase [Deltaproteobacteria bacterium HGW-Deltaproteobacteria-14]